MKGSHKYMEGRDQATCVEYVFNIGSVENELSCRRTKQVNLNLASSHDRKL